MPGSLVGREPGWLPQSQGDGIRGVGTVLALVVLATVVATFARRWRIPAPSLLVVAGLAVALLPGTPEIRISPQIIGDDAWTASSDTVRWDAVRPPYSGAVIATQPADGPAGASRRQPARLAVLVAVLLGLFLMHGGPASAEAGCHGAMPGTAATHHETGDSRESSDPDEPRETGKTGETGARTAAAMPDGMGTPVETGAHHSGRAARPAVLGHVQGVGDKAVAQPDTSVRGASMRGALCVATTPRSELPQPPLSAVGLLLPAAVLLPGAWRTYDGTRRRGPPPGGRQLLLQVCVART
ncbi:hypothetical protein [Streptomyces sp. NPDC002520]